MKANIDETLLKDILDAIQEIEACFADNSRERTKEMAMAYAIAIIGEAANRISPELQQTHPDVPWKSIIGMRHRIIHGYANLDRELLWAVVRKDIPELKRQIISIIKNTG